VWNTLESRYLYDEIRMEKTLELQKSVEGGHMATLHEPWNHSTEGDSPLSYNGIRGVK
jgi:hypothetical protein